MDPLTHTLVGAGLAATDLGRKSRRATAALVLGANLPDIDVLSYFRGSDFALGFRRGWTHGVPALAVLPLVLTGILLLWDRWRSHDDDKRALSPGWLLTVSYLACATHPCLDWLNTYGMRWWMPFRDSWTYGDSVFIVDPWLWLILGLGWLIGRRSSALGGTVTVVLASLLLLFIGNTAPTYLPLVGGVVLTLLAAYFWRSWPAWLTVRRVAVVALASGLLYIGAMITLHGLTISRVRQELSRREFGDLQELMVGPMPANPLAWDIVVGSTSTYRWGRWDWHQRRLVMADDELPASRAADLWPELVTSGQSPGFLTWVRFPWLEIEEAADGHRIYLMDARYTRDRQTGFGGTIIELAEDPPRTPSP